MYRSKILSLLLDVFSLIYQDTMKHTVSHSHAVFYSTFIGAVILLTAGCTQQTTVNTDTTNANTNVDSANTNTNADAMVNTNVELVNENTNAADATAVDTNEATDGEITTNTNTNEIDTSAWLTYTSEELGLSFLYPKIEGSITEFESSCDDNRCFSGRVIGWEYKGIGESTRLYTLAAAVTENFAVDRATWPTDYFSFEKQDDLYTLNYSAGDKDIEVEREGNSNGQPYIVYKFDSLDPYIDDTLRDAYVAMVKFPNGYNAVFKAFTLYFEHPTSIEEVIASVQSVQFN